MPLDKTLALDKVEPVKTKTKITAFDIENALRAKYSSDQWRIWFEVSQSTGFNSGRRADAFAMNIWPSKDYLCHAFEVKVSRADFKKEMEDLTKWKGVGKYANFFWLTCPVGLVSVDEIPSEWGLMELTKGGLRIKKQAPARTDVAELTKGFAASLLRTSNDIADKKIEKRAEEIVSQKIDVALKQQKFETAQKLKQFTKLENWKKRLEAKIGEPINTWTPPEYLAEKLLIAKKLQIDSLTRTQSAAKEIVRLIDELTAPTRNYD